MRSLLIALVSLLVVGSASAQDQAPSEELASPEEVAALDARIDELLTRMGRDLDAQIERQTLLWLAARFDTSALVQRAAAPRGSDPARLAAEAAGGPSAHLACAVGRGERLECRVRPTTNP